MPKKKEKSESEWYRGLIRDQKKQIRKLTQLLKYYEQRKHILEQEYIPDEPKEDSPITCPECQKGVLEHKTVLDRFWSECSLCSYRTTTKRL